MRLTRDTRDTLFLLAVIGWILLLQAPYIPAWCTGLTVFVLIWRSVLAWQQKALPAWPWKLLLLLVAVAGTLATHRTLLGQNAGVTLIVLLLALKTLELRARRDALVVFYLGFFTLLTQFLQSQSLLTAIGIMAAVLGLLTALVNAHRPLGRPPLWHSAQIAAGMTLLGTPLMLALFLLFPRFAPLWGVPAPATQGHTGLSADMVVGQVASLAQDESVALRVRFKSTAPPQSTLYFRGPVLTRFDGRQWHPLPVAAEPPQLQVQGPGIPYQLTLEPHRQEWLLALDATPNPPDTQARQDAQMVWRSGKPITDVRRYEAMAFPNYRLGPKEFHASLEPALQLPSGFDPRTRAWAQQLLKQHGQQPEALIAAVLQHLQTGGYRYTLEPGIYGLNTADEFWFERKAGFCEHIASGFAVLVRALGVPARVVTGYQGGSYNALGQFWSVRQSDAHAWTEVWFNQRGWVRIDPTAYVQPSRIEGSTRLQPPPGLVGDTLGRLDPTLLAHLRNLWDATNNHWNQWVLNYTQNRQFELLRQFGLAARSGLDLLILLLGALGTLALTAAVVFWWRSRQRDPWQRLLNTARNRLGQAGLVLPTHATPRQMQTALAASARHSSSHDLQQWLLDLESARYNPVSQHTLSALHARLHRLHWPDRTTIFPPAE